MTRSKIFLARAGALMLALACAGAHAATITVNTTSDAIEADGFCSIREAVANANNNAQTYADCAAGNGADSIVFDAIVFSAPQTIVLGDVLSLTDAQTTTIDSAGKVTLDGGNATTILSVGYYPQLASVQLNNLVFDHGYYGAIFNGGTLTMTDCTVTGSVNSDYDGGGIYNFGTLTLTRSRVTGNSSISRGGGIGNDAQGTVNLIASTVSGNTADYGGGIYNNYGTVNLLDSTVSGNTARSNVFMYDGGGIFNNDTLNLTNSTVSGNQASLIGGIQSASSTSSVKVTLIGSTVSANYGYDVYATDGNYQTVSIKAIGSIATIMGANLTADSYGNLTGNDVDPNLHLGPLQDNGGSTQTMRPAADSPAIDAIACTDLPATDQRGVVRPQGVACDIGAVEVVVNDLIFANGFEAPSQCSGVTAASAVWGDEFAGGNLSATLWNANVNGGSLVESNGVLAVSSTANQFPFVTAISPIPATGSFSVRWKAQYTNLAPNGDGTLVISNGLPTNGAADNYAMRRADAWQDSTNGYQVRARTTDAGSYGPLLTLAASSTATHDVEYCWLPSTVEIWVDDALQSSTSTTNLTRPDSLWFGNPVVRGVSGQPWTSFALDYVRVKALTTQ